MPREKPDRWIRPLPLALLPLQLLFVFKGFFTQRRATDERWEGFNQLKLINYLASLLQITSVAAIY